MNAAIQTPADAMDAKGLQSRSLRGQQAVIDARLPEDLKGVLVVLLRHHNDQSGLCCPSQELIAAKLGVTDTTVRARLRKLEQRGLVTIHRMGRWTRYTIHFQAIDALELAVVPVDNSLDTLNPQAQYPQITPSIPVNHASDTLKTFGLTGKGTGYRTEGGTEACADAVDKLEATFPPLPISEDLKTEQPVTAVNDMEAPAAAPAPEPAPAVAVAIAPDTLAAVNAQRVRNGKAVLSRADLAAIGREATLAGIAPQAAAEWILAKPARSFFKADYHKPLTAGVVSAPAAPIDEAAKAQARAKADQVQAELVRRSIEAMRQGSAASIVLPASAAPITRPDPLRTVTLRHAAPTSFGSTGTGWACQAVDGFLAGEPVAHAKLTNAAAALGLAVRDLKAQRAANTAAVAA